MTRATSELQALVLDYGGVISVTMFELHRHTEQVLGLASGSLDWRGPFDPIGDPLWCDMLAGVLSERDYWDRRATEVGRLVGEDWAAAQTLMRRSFGHMPDATTRPEAAATIRAARAAGRKVGVLTNELDLFNGPAYRHQLAVLREVDVIVDATYTGILKPDARAYQAVAEALGVPLEACLMVDDQPRNVEGALRAGMQAQWFDVTQAAETYRVVRARLGLTEQDAALPLNP